MSPVFLIPQPRNPVPESMCRQQIERIAASVTFARAEQLRDLLRWLGTRSLGEGATSPSEKEIAQQVMKRPDFDPRSDALVRKEMGRLREKLARYYRSEGMKDPVAATADGGYLLKFAHRVGVEAKTCWLVLPFRVRPDMSDAGGELLEELLIALNENGAPELVSPATALAYAGRSGDLRQFALECRADVVIEGSLRRRGEAVEALVWVVDGASARTRRARRITGADMAGLASAVASWLVETPH